MNWDPELEELRRREAMAREMGGPDKVKRQHDGGRLTVRERVEKLVVADQQIQTGLPFWNKNILSDAEREHYRDLIADTKTFLESLQVYTTPGKLKNFRYGAEEVKKHAKGLAALAELGSIQELITELAGTATYLSQAEMALPEEHDWIKRMRDARTKLLQDISDGKKRVESGFRQKASHAMKTLQGEYIQIYLDLHRSARLGVNDDKKKAALLKEQVESMKTLLQSAQNALEASKNNNTIQEQTK